MRTARLLRRAGLQQQPLEDVTRPAGLYRNGRIAYDLVAVPSNRRRPNLTVADGADDGRALSVLDATVGAKDDVLSDLNRHATGRAARELYWHLSVLSSTRPLGFVSR